MAQGFKEIEGMGIPLHQVVRIGSYLLKKRLTGVKRYPLVLMLEPLFRCNLACAGCGKIDYPDEILNSACRWRIACRRWTSVARPWW